MCQAQTDNDVVNGTFLVNGIYVSCLFDTGADNCFVSFEFEKLLSRKRSYLPSSFDVEVATGRTVSVNSVLRDCTPELNNHIFPIDLIPMQLGSFDVIKGMDFLRCDFSIDTQLITISERESNHLIEANNFNMVFAKKVHAYYDVETSELHRNKVEDRKSVV